MVATSGRRSNQERREHSIEQVLAAALRRFVDRGYFATSIDDIARDAGLTKGAVYFYFKGKSALLLDLLAQSSKLYLDIFGLMQASGRGAAAQLEMFVEWAARVGVKNKDLLLLPILMSLEFNGRDEEVENTLNRFYDRYHEELERVVKLGQKNGEFNPDLAPREEAAVLVAFTDGMLMEWIRRSQRLDGNRLVMSAKALIAGGLRKTP